MSGKPFYRSRKFIYALGTLLAALVLAILPNVVTLDATTEEMLTEMLPLVFVLGLMVITGHTATDLVATWREGVPAKPLGDAAHDMIDALPLGERAGGLEIRLGNGDAVWIGADPPTQEEALDPQAESGGAIAAEMERRRNEA